MTLSDPNEVRDAFTAICQEFKKFFKQGDHEAIGALYWEDAKILPPNMDIVEGKDSIQKFWKRALEMGLTSYEPEIIDVESSGYLGFFIGKYTLYGNASQVINEGKFLTIFKNIDGLWKIYRDIFNSSMPPEKK